MSEQMTLKQVKAAIKNERLRGKRVAILAILPETMGKQGLIHRPDNIEYRVSFGEIVAVGKDVESTDIKVGKKVRFNQYAPVVFDYETDQGSFKLQVVNDEDIFWEVDDE